MSDTKIQVSDGLIRMVRAQIKRQTGEEVNENRLRAFILMNQMKTEINNDSSVKPLSMFWKYVWSRISGRGMEDYLQFLMWLDLSTSIKNAQSWVILQPEKPTWEQLVEEIKMYCLTSQLPIIEKYLPEVERLFKSE